MSEIKKTLVRLGLLGILISCLWLYQTAQTQSTKQERKVPVIVKQIDTDTKSSVDLRCESITSRSPNVIGGISCVVKNKTKKNISATNLSYSIALDSSEGPQIDTKTLTSVTLVHPDFKENYKPITPNTERIITSASVSYNDATTIVSVEVELDYLEFEDGSAVGPNKDAAKTIQQLKEGASIYKNWLAQKLRAGENILDLAGLVDREESFPDELMTMLASGKREDGARAYRSYARRQVRTHGAAELEKYLRK